MSNIIEWLFGIKSGGSGGSASNRMKKMLAGDRTQLQLPPETMQALKNDLAEVLRKYCQVDDQNLQCFIASEGRQAILNANVPVIGRNKTKVAL